MLKISLLVAVAAVSVGAGATTAGAAGLDSSFGTGGITTTDFALGSNAGQSVVVSPSDGKVTVAGADGDNDAALLRYMSDGALDTGFSDDGKAFAPMASTSTNPGSGVQAMVRQPDGEVVVSGGLEGGTWELLRFDADGRLDSSFGTAGRVVTRWNGGFGAGALALQPDGRIVAVGTGDNGWAIARYDADGALDTSFSGDGKQVVSFGATCCPNPSAVAVGPGGTIIVGGSSDPGFAGDATSMTVARLTADGDLDASFSGDGIQSVTFTGTRDHLNALAVSGTKIIVAGYTAQPGGPTGWNDAAIARLNADGTPDTSFSGDGVQTTDFDGVYDAAQALAVQADGKPVIAGRADSSKGGVAVVRYAADGTPDPGFSGDGVQQFSFSSGTYFGGGASALALQPDGKLVVAGADENRPSAIATARLSADGTLDHAFAGNGIRLDRVGGGQDIGYATARQPDGRTLVAGSGLSIARYTAAGALDPTFSGDGVQTLTGYSYGTARAIDVLPEGKILTAGALNGQLGVVRYASDGSLDTGFGTGGMATVNTGGFTQQANAMAVQADGSIVLAGISSNQMTLKRLTALGSADATFATPAALSTAFGSAGIVAMLQQPDGKLVLFGGAPNSYYGDLVVARTTANGSLDPSFSGDGLQTVAMPGGAMPSAAALDPNDKIVLAGIDSGYPASPTLARLNGDGSLDTSFSGDGIARVAWTTQTSGIGSVIVDAEHRIIVAGSVYDGPYDGLVYAKKAVVARYTSDGVLDSGFAPDGRVSFDLGVDDQLNGGFLTPDGHLTVAGSTGTDFAIASLLVDGQAPANDATPPTISIATPAEGQHFAQGQTVQAAFTCTDAASSVDRCNGPSTVDTAVAGAHTFTVSATDHAGNSTSKSVSYAVDAPSSNGGDGGDGGGTTTAPTSTPNPGGGPAGVASPATKPGQTGGAGGTTKTPVTKKPLTATQKRTQARTKALKACKKLKTSKKRAACVKAVNKKYAPLKAKKRR